MSYAEYVGATHLFPTPVIDSGHFVAYFREKDVWYRADDSVVSVVEPSHPKAFPYLCIFERVGLPVSEPWLPNPVTAAASEEPLAPKRCRRLDKKHIQCELNGPVEASRVSQRAALAPSRPPAAVQSLENKRCHRSPGC